MKVHQILPNGNLFYTADLLMAELFNYNKPDVTFSLLKKNDKKADLCHYHTLPPENDTAPGGIISLHEKIVTEDGLIKDADTLRQFSRINCNSDEQKQLLEQNGFTNLQVLNYGVDKKRFEVKKETSGKIRIGILNRSNNAEALGRQLNYIISLFKTMDTQRFSFSLAGLDIEDLYSTLTFLGYECSAHDYLPPKLIPAFFASVDVVINLSGYAEAMTLAEAVWTGTPYISRIADGEYFESEQGIIISGNQEADIDALNDLQESGRIKEMRESILAGRNRILSWEDYAAAIYREYEPEVVYAAA